MEAPTPEDEAQAGLVEMLLADNARMRRAGCDLAAAALQVAGEYDGVHRLLIAAGKWAEAVASEGGRGERYGAGS